MAETGSKALEALELNKKTHAVILNAISLRTNGTRTCASLKGAAPDLPVLIVTDQDKPVKADELLEPNISTRKLINKVDLFSPLNKKRCLQYGDIFLDEEKQLIFSTKGISQLSTKEIQILKYLIKKKGSSYPWKSYLPRSGKPPTLGILQNHAKMYGIGSKRWLQLTLFQVRTKS